MNIYTRILICLAVVAVLAAQSCAAPTPFMICGWVNHANGDPVNNPNLTIRNVNTSETFVVETNASSNYYQVMTSSLNASAGNVSNFSVNGGAPTNRAVTSDEMDAGGFEHNITIESSAEPDLNVSEISVNPNCKPGTLRANTTNEICAKIWNNGTAAAGQFNVSFLVTGSPGGYSKEVTVLGLGSGNNTTVCITDYQPTSPGAVTINVTADCNLTVGESDEGNNSMVESATVYNSGYMGKRLTGGEDIVLVTKEEGNIDLMYAVCNATTYVTATGMHDFGDNQTYLSGTSHPNWTEYRARWDNDPQLPIPSGETIKKATLYVYYTTSYYPVPDFNVSFNGMNYTMDDAVHRTDVKGWPSTSAYSNAPSGMLTYDVASEFDNTTNTMVVYNLKEPGPDKVTLQGAVLAVVYEHDDEPERIIYVNEGFDLLASTTYSCCTPDEATAYADFLNVPDPTLFVNATLVTISTGATNGAGMNKLFFNGEEWDGGLKNGTFPTEEGWAPPAVESWMDITANETNVLGSLLGGDNTARFQDSGDLLCMANAFLKLEKGEGPKPELYHINVTPASWTLNISESVNFTATGFDQNNTEISGLVFEWARSDEYVGNFTLVNDTTVNFTAEHVGIAYLTASSNGMTSDPVQVTVNAQTVTGNVTNGTGTATSGNSTATVKLSNESVNGTVTIKELDDPLNSTTVNGSTAGLGTGVKLIKGVNITASGTVTDALEKDTNRTSWIHIKIEYDDSQLGDIDENTLFIYKYVNGSWEKLVSGSNNCTANGRNTTANYIWANMTRLCDLGVGGSVPEGSGDSTGGSTGGRGGTYPPGWLGTPTPTVTAPAAPATVTTALPGEHVTAEPTKAKPAVTKTTTSAADETTAEKPKKGAPGFTAVFVIAGVLAVAYAMMRRRG